VIFRVEGKPIFGHKCLVFSRCPQLRTMFAWNSRIAKDINELPIDNMKYQIFIAVLHYLYTDHVKVAPHLISELALAARKLKLGRLEKICLREAIPSSTFKKDLQQIVNDPFNADIMFAVNSTNSIENSVVYGHKIIMAARSEYFKTIFESGFKEHASQIIAIDGLELNVFLAVMSFIYTADEVVARSDKVIDIMIAADRFLLEDLKQICESELENALDPENCAMLLDVADRYNAPRLKRLCMETIINKWDIIKSTQGLAQLPKIAPNLLREIDFYCNKHSITSPGEVVRTAARISVLTN